MPLILNGTTGVSGVDGSAGTPSYQGIDTNTGIFYPAADTIAFAEGGTEVMRIDSSGNVGIGTSTPSTGTLNRQLTINSGANPFAGIVLQNNATGTAFNDGFQIYLNGTTGTLSLVENSPMTFEVNGPERMRIDSSGNVRIGATGALTTNERLTVATTTTDTYSAFQQSSGITAVFGVDATGAYSGSYTNQAYVFRTNNTERMRITSGGLVGINTTTFSTSYLTIDTKAQSGIDIYRSDSTAQYNGIRFRNTTNGSTYGSLGWDSSGLRLDGDAGTMYFSTSGTERMRITSAGYFKASNDGDYAPEGSTSTVHQFCQTSNSVALSVVCRNTGQSGDTVRIESYRNTTNNSFYFMGLYNRTANAFKLQIADSGNVTNTNGSYGTISDAKNKENIVDATPKLNKVNQLKVRNFNFKGDDLKQIGFVAQEFEQVFPSMVEEHHDKDADGNDLGTTTKSIKTSVLVPILVKAIQEQQVMIEELKQEVAKLKGF